MITRKDCHDPVARTAEEHQDQGSAASCSELHDLDDGKTSDNQEEQDLTAVSYADEGDKPHKRHIIWTKVFLFVNLHVFSLYAIYLVFTSAKINTIYFAVLLYFLTALSITAGVHRLWSHRSYKAKWPLRLFLAIFNSMAFQNNIFEWARDHRSHHKYSDTNADPHNSTRGFFFSHIGWLLEKKHPDVIRMGKKLDVSDLIADPIVRYQKKVYLPSVILLCFVIPTLLPNWLWNESLWNGYFIAGMLRYCLSLNCTWLVNSAAHMWGYRPYDKYINPRENFFVVLVAQGEGYHNFHHTFPYDYSTSEFKYGINFTTFFIDAMALIGLAYDRKFAPMNSIAARKLRTGE